jgi:phosphonate transport system substrate-binding protein
MNRWLLNHSLPLWSGLAFGAITLPALAQVNRALPATPDVFVVGFGKTYSPPETYTLYGRFLEHLERCANVRLLNFRGDAIIGGGTQVSALLSEQELLDGLGNGAVHLALLTTGLVPPAMDRAHARPFAVRGNTTTSTIHAYRLNLLVRADSTFRTPTDLRGKKIAHTSPGSNSGNLAPRAYFPDLGLRPDVDYTVVYSKDHERSIYGVFNRFYDGAAIASDQLRRLEKKGELSTTAFRVLWESPPFPPEAWTLARSVRSEIATRVERCTLAYRFPTDVSQLLDGADAFLPIDPSKEYAAVRFVAQSKHIGKAHP